METKKESKKDTIKNIVLNDIKDVKSGRAVWEAEIGNELNKQYPDIAKIKQYYLTMHEYSIILDELEHIIDRSNEKED